MQVRVEAAPADHVAARRRDGGAAEAREQRAGERGTRRGSGRRARRRPRASMMSAAWTRTSFGPIQSTSAPRPFEQLDHRLDVLDPRHVREHDRLVGEQARGEDRQRAVLVPRGANAPAERAGRPRSRRTRRPRVLTTVRRHRAAGILPPAVDADPRAGLGDTHPLHEERGAAAPRARRRGLDRVVRPRASARTRSSGA